MNPRVRPTGKPNSLFEFVEEFCYQEKSGAGVNRAVHRLCSLMRKMWTETVIIEDIPISSDDIARECQAIRKFFDSDVEIVAFKFTFITEKITQIDDIEKLKDENFLSTAILINYKSPDGTWGSYLYKAIVSKPRVSSRKVKNLPLLNNYLHIYRTFQCETGLSDSRSHKYNITGTFFCQQNARTSVCAHVSLCMALNNMDAGREIVPEDINAIIGVDHQSKKFGGANSIIFTDVEVKMVLKHYKLSIVEANFFKEPNRDYAEFIYRYIEGRCPVLLAFTTNNPISHVVPILGHTLNSDIWKPEAESLYSLQAGRLKYNSAAAWVDHFIMHDDNLGMYLCLPVDSLKKVTLPMCDPTFRAYFATAIVPENVTTPSWEAEWASVIIVKDLLNKIVEAGIGLDNWLNRIYLSDRIKPIRPIVVRTFLTNISDYSRSLDEEDFEGCKLSESDKSNVIKDLPSLFWLSEITLPDLYTANRTKIIDSLYSATCKRLEDNDQIFERWIQIRFPNALFKRDAKTGDSLIFALSVKSHYPLMMLESQKDAFQW